LIAIGKSPDSDVRFCT